MKKFFKVTSMVIVICMLASSLCMKVGAAGKKVKLNKKTATIRVGDNIKLKVKNRAKKAKVTWRTKNKKIATVTKKGKVTGRKVGNTKIICTVTKGNKKVKLLCKIKVAKKQLTFPTPSETGLPGVEIAPNLPIEQKPTPTANSTDVPTTSSTPIATPMPEQEQGDSRDANGESVLTGKGAVKIGMSLTDLRNTFGNEAYILPAEYNGCEWYIYNSNYEKFVMVLVKDKEVVGVYTDSKELVYADINTETKGSTLKANGFTTYDNETYYLNSDEIRITAFVDALDDSSVEGILVMKNISRKITADSATTFEKVSFELTNAFRVKNGMDKLIWNKDLANVAKAHSKDMYDNDYFSHTSPSGKSLGDRLEAAGLKYRAYAENIAYGYSDGIHVTHGWINSSGHRSNMLFDAVKELGVGVESNCSYYTQVFYSGK